MAKFNLLAKISLFCCLIIGNAWAGTHQHSSKPQSKQDNVQQQACDSHDIKCAKTVTAAFAPNGDLWRLWVRGSHMYFQISDDNGQNFSAITQVAVPEEKVSARNENRPKIAFDNHQGVYLSWAMPREKKYTADVRFAYSKDYGNTFTQPVTVNNDNLLAGHSFNEMLVTAKGDISIVWLDGRLSHQLRTAGKKTNGSALFLAKANFRENQTTFSNQQLANNTCVCCRIAMDFNQQGEPAIFWRHIYGDNIREFALLTLKKDEKSPAKPYQISHDHWQINGCPHQGGAISIDDNNRYHMVWFNQGDVGKGIFYAASDDQGKTLSTPISVGDNKAQSAHPHLIVSGNKVAIVWLQFNGTEHELWQLASNDLGKTFAEAKLLGKAKQGADRPFIIKKANKAYVSWHRLTQGHLFQAL